MEVNNENYCPNSIVFGNNSEPVSLPILSAQEKLERRLSILIPVTQADLDIIIPIIIHWDHYVHLELFKIELRMHNIILEPAW